MATRVLGPTGSRRRRRFLLVSLVLVSCTALLLVGSARAVHDFTDGMQLDGDVSHACPAGNAFCLTTQQDWATLFNVTTDNTAHTQTVSPDPSVVGASGSPFTNANFQRDFESGPNCTTNSTQSPFCTGDDTTFATGSKDTLDITGWQCNHDNNVNSKIDIMNAYAAAYTIPAGRPNAGDKVLYFGMEKNKNNGTNDVGFWFLQGDASCSSPPTSTWNGTHTVGDVLVVSEFTLGGGVSNITAYRWVGGSNPLVQIGTAQGSGGDCKTALSQDVMCATTNSGANPFNGNITTPWLTSDATLTPKPGNTVVPPDFFEGGIDVTRAFQQSGGGTAPSCFNTFIGDTRSSTSLTATLFDYASGSLGQCQTTLSTQENKAAGTDIGTGVVSSGTDTATLTITGTSTWNGTLTWYLCGPGVTSCDSHGVQVTSKAVHSSDNTTTYTSDAAFLTSAGTYCWHAHFEPDADSAKAGVKPKDDNGANECFSVAKVKPILTTQATCRDDQGNLVTGDCVLGVNTLRDTATLSGTASQPGTTGLGGDTGLYKSIYLTDPTSVVSPADSSITWHLYKPASGGCTTDATGFPTSRTVSGDNTYPTSLQTPVQYKPALTDGVGTYTFVASYPADSANMNAADTTSCPDTSGTENITLIGSASSASDQRWLPNDRVTLTTSGGTLSGTLTVTLYSGTFTVTNGVCTPDSPGSTAITGQTYTFNPSGDASGSTYLTTNSTFFVGTGPAQIGGVNVTYGLPGAYFWLVQYNDNNLTDPKDRCESSNVTITN
jgi:hypothetical protein